MKVHFTGSNYKLSEHLPQYKKIIDLLKADGHTLTREWIEEDLEQKKRKEPYSIEEYRDIWKKVKASIMEADVVVIEAWNNSFSIGYQTAYALSHKKPTLVLTPANLHTKLSHTIIAGEDNPFLFMRHYTDENLPGILQEFLTMFQVNTKDMRFNMFIDRETQVYLDMEAYKTGKTKAKIIRDMIKREINNNNGL